MWKLKIESELTATLRDFYHKLISKKEPVIDTLPKFKVDDDIWVLGVDNAVDKGKIVDVVPGNRYVVYRYKYNENHYDLFDESSLAKRNGN